MTIDEELDRAERCLRLFLKRPVREDKRRLRRRSEWDKKLAALIQKQNEVSEAVRQLEEKWKHNAEDDSTNQ